MSESKNDGPDHTLFGADIQRGSGQPEVFAVTSLRPYVKPQLDEELGLHTGGAADCGTELLCTCVPFETCACNTVTYHAGGCPCTCTGTCGSTSCYWYYYFT